MPLMSVKVVIHFKSSKWDNFQILQPFLKIMARPLELCYHGAGLDSTLRLWIFMTRLLVIIPIGVAFEHEQLS